MGYRQSRRLTAMLGAAMLLAACASKHAVSQADWEQGAREGKITRDYAAGTGAALPACVAALPADERATHHFVLVRYTQARHVHVDIAELPADLHAAIGDNVQIWPEECAAGKYGRITQVFPAKHS